MTRAFFVIIFVLVRFAFAQDLSGRWAGTFRAEGGEHGVPQLFFLKQDGRHITGSGGPDESEQYPISNGAVTGRRVHMEVTTAQAQFFYDLSEIGDDLRGSLEIRTLNNVVKATVSLKKER